jgi:squalene-hopene/tetraprenyl-beta-curcumene cyclase
LAASGSERRRRWGESADSYELDYKGFVSAMSVASQKAWALLGLMGAGEPDRPTVARGIASRDATARGTGSGMRRSIQPRYSHVCLPALSWRIGVLPLWTHVRYRKLKRGNGRATVFGL